MMLILRIRKAEVAMKDGRLDDAYQQAICEDVRDHRRGQRLISRLASAYLKRGTEHLKASNPQAALADAERATRLGGNQPKITSLREEAQVQLSAQQNERHRRRQAIAAARQCIAAGDFSLGAKFYEPLDKTGNTVAGLVQDAELTRQKVDAAVAQARQAAEAQDWEQALTALAEAKRVQPGNVAVGGVLGQITQSMTKQIRSFLGQGRLDQADALLRRLSQQATSSLEVDELSRMLATCREAYLAMRSANVAPAIENLKSLKQVLPEAKWLDGAIKDVGTAAHSIEALRTGPLGLLAHHAASAHTTIAKARNGTASPMPEHTSTDQIPDSFVIHVDGAGSFLVVRHRHTEVGSQSRSRPVNVAILGQPSLPRITIERTDGDYFLSADQPVEVNGGPTSSTLLGNQDLIRLGRRGAIKFTQPCAASTSAVLEFRGLRLAHGNARQVILMDDALVLGPQSSAHVKVPQLERAMVLHVRDGVLRLRPMSRVGEHTGVPVELNRPQDLDGLSLAVTEVAEVA